MINVETAKTRAEALWQNLQQKARGLKVGEKAWVKTASAKADDLKASLTSYKGMVSQKVEGSKRRLFSALELVNKDEITALQEQLASLKKEIQKLGGKKGSEN